MAKLKRLDLQDIPLEKFRGPVPDHKWEGTALSFEKPDGEWGESVDLQGPPMGGSIVSRLRQLLDVDVSGSDGDVLTIQGGEFVFEPGGGGVSDHGALTGLLDDDHPQYHNDTRGDIRYYTKAETYTQAAVDALLANKSDVGHIHDDRYYTESELNAGQLNSLYYTESELNAGQLDTRYFTEAEVTSLLAGKSNVGHTHVSTDITDFNEAAQDAVGGILTDTSEIDFTYDDAGNTISALVGAIAQSKVTNLVTDLAAKHVNIQFQDEGSNLGATGTANVVNFTGAGVTASRATNTVTVNIPGGGGGGVTTTTVEANLGSSPTWTGTFTITDAAIGPTSKLKVWQAEGPYTGKGTRADEAEMDQIEIIAAYPGSGSASVRWRVGGGYRLVEDLRNGNPVRSGLSTIALPQVDYRNLAYNAVVGRVKGNVKFHYQVFS